MMRGRVLLLADPRGQPLRAVLPRRHHQHGDLVARGDVAEQRGATAELDVVGVGPDRQHLHADTSRPDAARREDRQSDGEHQGDAEEQCPAVADDGDRLGRAGRSRRDSASPCCCRAPGAAGAGDGGHEGVVVQPRRELRPLALVVRAGGHLVLRRRSRCTGCPSSGCSTPRQSCWCRRRWTRRTRRSGARSLQAGSPIGVQLIVAAWAGVAITPTDSVSSTPTRAARSSSRGPQRVGLPVDRICPCSCRRRTCGRAGCPAQFALSCHLLRQIAGATTSTGRGARSADRTSPSG